MCPPLWPITCLIILRERYFEALYVIDPRGWLTPGEEWILGPWSAAAPVIILTAAVFLCFAGAVERRVYTL